MKDSHILYLLVIALSILGFIAAKSTIKKMQESGHEVDVIYLKLNSSFEKINDILFEMEDSLATYLPKLFDSLHLSSLSKIPEVDSIEAVDFEIFNNNLFVQIDLIEKVDIVLGYFRNHSKEKSKEINNYLESLLDIKMQIKTQTKEYNNRARLHNAFIKKFPRNFYSSFFHFQSKPYY